ncbi:SusC/RagA family TonB-linked outer membrane protein [Chitinophaga sp. CF118]|uniref:SusC/RagA family TonB-linked outer membrane protein n=1 Tax=Chitinophaga sp. CF118 TaxID=1884367 RepID=UPI0015A5A78B|nr:SusC/RagA family TonB-linked outer membrane protein [Chitinophaga sp. CF118]
MKLTVILLTVAFLNVQATGFSQNVTLSGKNLPLKKVFNAIEEQTGFMVFYNQDVLANARPVSVSVKEMSLTSFLNVVLADLPVSYIIEGKTIYLSQQKIVTQAPSQLPPGEISGTVRSTSGELLAGVSIKLKRSNTGTITSQKGTFKLSDVAEGDVVLVSIVGYMPVEIVVHSTGESFTAAVVNRFQATSLKVVKGEIAIIMTPVVSNLSEVIVNKGYYTESQRLSTGSVSSIDSKIIEKQPVTNVLQALQGRVPGLSIVQSNGFPGTAFNVQVRGVNSMLRTSTPLYIVDGVPFLSEAINAQTGTEVTGSNGSTSPLNSISPADIERIEVLKDGDATAIYGSRGANGVILITTKKGKPGKTRFDLNVNTGVSHIPKTVPELNTKEYLELRKLGFKNSGTTPNATNAPDLVLWDQNAYTDFQKLLIGNTAKSTDVNASVSGGDLRTNFLISGTYHNETTVYYLDKSYKRGSANFSVNHNSIDQKLGISFSVMYSADNNRLAVEDLTSRAYQTSPNFPLYNPNGSLYWSGSLVQNPIAVMMRTNRNKTSNLNSNLNIRYRPFAGLEFKILGGFGRADMDQAQLIPLASQDRSVATNTSRSIFSYSYTNNYIVEPQVSYVRGIGLGKISALIGGSWQYSKSRQPYYTLASDFISDEFLENIGSAATVTTRSSSADYKFASVFARLNYTYKERYVLNGIFRRDGSSRFGPSNRFGNFGSIGAAWIFTDEPFMAAQQKWLSSGKLRGSYGITGSDNIGNYGYLDTYSSTSYNYNGSPGLFPSRIANSNYKWEQTKKIEIALELGFLKNRIRFTPAYYNNNTGNQLITYTISSQAGFSSYQANMPATVQNSGLELTLSTINIVKKNFTWTSNFNFSMNRNKLKSYPDLKKSSYYTRYVVGDPVSSIYIYKYAGYDSTTGLPKVADLDKSGTISSGLYAKGLGDRYYYGTSYPKYFGGFNNSFTYKHFSLDVMLQFVKQTGRDLLVSNTYPPGYIYNVSKSSLDKYLADGPADKRHVLAGYNSSIGNYFGSDAMMVDASFIRLKSVAFSYDLPAQVAMKMKMNAAKLYIQGQNLFTITSYKGFDPESQGMSLPPLRTLSAGLKISF